MSRRKSTTNAAEEKSSPSFEEALATLEGLVEAMEHEQLPLEDLVTHYEQGSALLSHCESILLAAKGRIELITLRNQNEIALDSTATPADIHPHPLAASSDDPDEDDENDIRLF